MNKSIKSTVRVEKTAKLNQVKLIRISRRYSIAPIDVRELQLGFSVDIPIGMAEELLKDGYVKRVKSRPRTLQKRIQIPEFEKNLDNTSEDTAPSPIQYETGESNDENEELNVNI